MRTWLLLDCNYLAYRAWYAKGHLKYNDLHTGVVYGILQDIISLQDRFGTSDIAFCFDHGRLLREVDYPQYKAHRKDPDEEELKVHLRRQVKELKRDILPVKLGYRNVFFESGYEADDIIASLCLNSLGDSDRAIIVSSDHDLYQLITPRVTCFNPGANVLTTEKRFSKEFLVTPLQWIDVKAIAGCKTDGVEGIQGVGEKTASKFLAGTLNPESAAFKKIIKGNKIWRRNKHIVKLPFPATPIYKLRRDKLQASNWEQLAAKLGMKSLKGRAPVTNQMKGFGAF